MNEYPPIKVRLMAHDAAHHPQWIPDAELAIITGIPLTRLQAISRMPDWSAVTVGEMQRFVSGCRFDPTQSRDRIRLQDYESKCLTRQSLPFQWLRRSPLFQTECLPLIRLLSEQENSQTQRVA